jgi:hypothetical protein
MTDENGEIDGFHTTCGWCRFEVINFVAPPAMVEVTHELPVRLVRKSVDRICLECYAELIKLIAARAELSHA